MDVAQTLAAATAALDAGKRDQALAKLLDAWRALRHPRIANLVEFVSDELTAKTEPIKGKTATARIEAWHAIEQRRDPAELGRLLSTPWPGTWQKALPILQALLAWPDDPRMAMAFARIVDATPYDTWTSDAFYRPLFARLDELRDLRALPLLRAQLPKTKPHYYRRDMRPLEERAVKTLEDAFPDGAPAIPDDVEQALAAVEARYAERIAGVLDKAAGEAEFLAAILADPDDVAARAVYADWLQERGDPRGELITLQLARAAGRSTEATETRERKLIEEHGRVWAGTLDNWFEPKARRFEGGFFAGGELKWQRTPDVDAMLRDPAWKLVRVVASGSYGEKLVQSIIDRPELAGVRAIHVLEEQTAASIASGPERAITELAWDGDASAHGVDPHPIATCTALPRLRTLGLALEDGTLAWLADAPVLERLERIVVHFGPHLPALLEAVARRGGALREIVLVAHARHTRLMDDRAWRVVLQRDHAPGPFTRFVARYRPGLPSPGLDVASVVGWPLRQIPPAWLRELEVDAGRRLTIKADERAQLAATVATFTNLERCRVPWEAPKARECLTGRRLRVWMQGEPMLDVAKIGPLWELLRELEQHYDSFEVGYGSTLRPLGTDPFARLQKWAGNVRAERLELIRDGEGGKLVLCRSPEHTTTSIDLVGVERSPRELVAWFHRLLELAKFDTGGMSASDQHDGLGHLLHEYGSIAPGWLLVFGRLAPLLPLEQLADLANRPELAGLFVESSARNVLVGVAPTPEEVTTTRLLAVQEGLRDLIGRSLAARYGYDFRERVHAILGPVARELELSQVPGLSRTTVHFARERSPTNRLHCDLLSPIDEPTLHITLQADGAREASRWLADGPRPVKTRAQLEDALVKAAATAAAWFANPT